jgi:hypothetical protein
LRIRPSKWRSFECNCSSEKHNNLKFTSNKKRKKVEKKEKNSLITWKNDSGPTHKSKERDNNNHQDWGNHLQGDKREALEGFS